MPPEPSPRQVGSADLFDYALIREYALLLLGSPARHKLLFAVVLGATLAASALGVVLLPRTYTAETRILAERGSRVRYLPGDDAPLHFVYDLVLSDANLEAMVEQAKLVDTFDQTRSAAGVAKDLVLARLGLLRPRSERDKREGLVATLEKKIRVSQTAEGTVTIAVSWHDPGIAYRLALAAQENFVSGKEASEVTAINSTKQVLEKHALEMRQDIDRQLAALAARAARSRKQTPARTQTLAAPRAAASAVEAGLETLQTSLLVKRATLRRQEELRARRVLELEAEIGQLRETYTVSHPLVMEATQRLDELRADSPQLRELEADAASIENQIQAAGGTVVPPERAFGDGGARTLRMPTAVNAPNPTGDPEVDALAGQLRLLVGKYNSLVDRIEAVRMDLETTQAAFKHRYVVVRPPQVPTQPDSLKPPLLLAAGFALGLGLALFACAAIELAGGRIERAWQIERLLGVPVLGRLGA